MAYRAHIRSITKDQVPESMETQMAVQFSVTDNDGLVTDYKHGFPLEMSSEDIEAAVRLAADRQEERDLARINNADLDAANKNADEVIESLSGKEL